MTRLDLPRDYVDLLRELVAGGVEFVVVGGWAVAVHGHGRATDDLDILVHATGSNAPRVYAALERFGAPLQLHAVTPEVFEQTRYGYRLGRKPLLIEILTSIDGVTFSEATSDCVTASVEDFEIPIIGRAALLANKRAAARPKDLADVDALTADED